jgi:hypothetical protein
MFIRFNMTLEAYHEKFNTYLERSGFSLTKEEKTFPYWQNFTNSNSATT